MVGFNPGDVVDRYRVEQVIASGGFGLVLRARHVHLGTQHALKVLHAHGAAQRERLLREGRIQAALRHPGIVAVTDVVPVEGGVATVMELVEGPTLYAWRRAHPPTATEIDGIAEQLFAAIAHAHSLGIVHRDLKPDNVLVERRGADLHFRVTDFGLAAREDEPGERFTRSGQALGTPGYMAPEQFRDARSVDARADVYALGALLYELWAGRPPTTASSIVAAYAAAENAEHPSLTTLAPEAPGRMCEAIEAALRPDPEHRPPTIDAMRALWRGRIAPPIVQWSDGARLAADVGAARDPDGPGDTLTVPSLAPTAALPAPIPGSRVAHDSWAPPPESRWATWLVAGGLVAALLLGIGIALSVRTAPPGPGQPADPPPAVEPEPPVPEVDLTSDAAPAEPGPVPAPAEAHPRPQPQSARVRLRGVAAGTLKAADGKVWSTRAAVPPGAYTLAVRFDEGEPVRVLAIDLRAGEERTITCTPALRVCE